MISMLMKLGPLLATLMASPLLGAEVQPLPPPPAPGPVVILSDRALDGTGGTLREVRIGVSQGRIVSLAAPKRGRIIDLRGYTVLPGWIDTHVHLESHFDRSGRIATDNEPPLEAATEIAGGAWDTLMAGFTTVQSVGDPKEKPLRDAIRDHGRGPHQDLCVLEPACRRQADGERRAAARLVR
jgi:hypothetical protein